MTVLSKNKVGNEIKLIFDIDNYEELQAKGVSISLSDIDPKSRCMFVKALNLRTVELQNLNRMASICEASELREGELDANS